MAKLEEFNAMSNNLQDLSVKKVMTKNPVSINQDTLAEKALSIMNAKKITSLCVHKDKNTKKDCWHSTYSQHTSVKHSLNEQKDEAYKL